MFKALLRSFALLLSGPLLLSVSLYAMEIWKWDKMAGLDQDEYIVILVQGSQQALKDAGRSDDAAKVHKLFTTNDENGVSIGMNEFMMTLALARKADADRITKDSGATRLEVEHAMVVMLKKNDIILPKSFMTVNKDFKPKHPPKEEKK